ncbi:hypothetical protein TL16_g01643 [Triparma laevis f. inornata]|uniref:Nucleotide-sugar transporter n=2 Tax=Triparma laevis TaxID=1534972 RepID=A0A9W7FRB4_9STRA|nr:hypothetical protein TL16_g01643 [Triparma laevis f. inornata]GMI16583.1 hypothetical protein TrLO_g15606 [Triparma laevis f. longispina]
MNFTPIQKRVLLILLLQNASYTLLRRYSIGVRHDTYNYHECLFLAELFKLLLSLKKIHADEEYENKGVTFQKYIQGIVLESQKMMILAWIYALMNVLSFVSLARIDASTFTIVAQLKVLSTGFFSYLILSKQFNKVKIVALFNLVCGAILVTTPSISNDGDAENDKSGGGKFIGVCAVALEVMLSGFASIYFEKVIKGAGLKSGQPLLGIFERNVQLALHSLPFYFVMIMFSSNAFSGWNLYGIMLAVLGGGGGILVALSVKYADSILKTLATSGSIVLSTLLGYLWLDGPLTFVMIIGVGLVLAAIWLYTFDPTPVPQPAPAEKKANEVEAVPLIPSNKESNV